MQSFAHNIQAINLEFMLKFSHVTVIIYSGNILIIHCYQLFNVHIGITHKTLPSICDVHLTILDVNLIKGLPF